MSQKPSKKGFFEVVGSALRRFKISPYDADGAKIHKIAAQIDAQGAQTIKKATLIRKNLRFEPKNIKKMGTIHLAAKTTPG